jgi:ribosome-associated protein
LNHRDGKTSDHRCGRTGKRRSGAQGRADLSGRRELKALDIKVLDVRGQTIIADFFVICTGTSNTHIRSIAGNIGDKMREGGFRAKPEGEGDSLWVVMDYGDAILHVLSEETREFYDLERLWGDAQISLWPASQSGS